MRRRKVTVLLDADPRIRGWGQTPYIKRPASDLTLISLFHDAVEKAIKNSDISLHEIDGLAVSSFTLSPDKAIDIAVKFGLKLRWIMDGSTGGASGVDMLQHARNAIRDGSASNILILAGDLFHPADFARLVENYNSWTQEFLSPLGIIGPNPLFAFVTAAQIKKFGIDKSVYGQLVIKQREWAEGNPSALYRQPMTMQDYLSAPEISDPLNLFDCVPVVSGASALVISARARSPIALIKTMVNHNFDGQMGDGTQTGLGEIAGEFWRRSGLSPSDIHILSLYDDYPAIVLAQLVDLGFIDQHNVRQSLTEFLANPKVRLNASGGQLSCGQNGAGGGLHGVIDILDGLKRNPQARYGLVSGYGMVSYRYGVCANLALFEVQS
jgi:acetyl-CoA acetyltransferase